MNRRIVIEPIDPVVTRIHRDKPIHEKLAIASSMWRAARQVVRAGLRRDHPEWSPMELERETSRRMSHGAF